MSGRILILGAAGRIGRAAAEVFRDAGWNVRSLVRGVSAPRAAPGTEVIEIDACDAESVIEAAYGADVILHALNVRYTDWQKFALPFADTAIAAARASGATLMFPGNVYNYGAGMPPVLDETTPMHPTSHKGALRVEIEARMRAAASDGARTIVLRAGDFYGGAATGAWLDRVITRYAEHGRLTYPGAMEAVHEWAYVPDFVAALVRLAAARDQFEAFDTVGFSGHAVTGHQLIAAIVKILGRNMKVEGMPWWFLRLAGRVVPTMNEIAEMSYLWEVPHRISGNKLFAAIGEIPHTPFDEALTTALNEIGLVRRR